jgi:hypothetical protein
MPFAEERNAISGVLEFTGRFLEYLITRLKPDDRLVFEDAWKTETKPQLELAIRMLRGEYVKEDIRRRAQEIYEERGREGSHELEDWVRAEAEFREAVYEDGWLHSFLRRVGLAGKSLKLKLQYLANAASGGWGKKLLDLLNKFLGSLAKGFTGAEQIKEFKEWVEHLLGKEPEQDGQIATIYSQGGPDPFRLGSL